MRKKQNAKVEKLETETVIKENGSRKLNEHVVMPKKGTIRYRLIDFSGRRNIVVERPPSNDGWFRSEKHKIEIPIDGNHAFNGGTEIWIDLADGIQITNFDGIRGWEGPDGRFVYDAAVGKMWALVMAAKFGDLMKYAKIAILLILVAVASPFLALLLKG
jgi:hypothetical protein